MRQKMAEKSSLRDEAKMLSPQGALDNLGLVSGNLGPVVGTSWWSGGDSNL